MSPDLVQLSYLSWLESEETTRQDKYRQFRDYYDGEHLTALTARMRKFLELRPDQEFNLNFCPIVVDSLAEKLKVLRFDCKGQSDTFTEWWQKNRMDGVQAVVHLSTIRDGDSYILVEFCNDRGIPLFTHENAYDGTQGMHVIYSDERRTTPVVAIKRWIMNSGTELAARRANLYFPDRIEKYTDGGDGGNWREYLDDPETEWPIPWTANDGSPLGIPVVHFRNKDQGFEHGESELEDVTPVQNGLNKAFIDLVAAADTTGFRIFWETGGDPTGMTIAPGSWIYNENPAAQFGVLEPAALDGLITLKDSIAADIAKITRTPLSFFQVTGAVSAEGTLKEQRSGLIAKARDRQVSFGNSWEDAVAMARKLANKFGSAGMNEDEIISTVWDDDEKPDSKALAEEVELLTRAQAASTKQKVKILHPDWDEKQIKEEVEAIQAEQGMAVPDIGDIPA